MDQAPATSKRSIVSESNLEAQSELGPSRKPPLLDPLLREAMLEHLRGQIRKIERPPVLLTARAESVERGEKHPAEFAQVSSTWTLGVPEVDALLGAEGLEIAGMHEIKPALFESGSSWAAGAAAAFLFALALGTRRTALPDLNRNQSAFILCCRAAATANELGQIYGPGLRTLGLDPDRFFMAEPAKEADVLWVMEEGLRSESLALVLGSVQSIPLTSARRLSLAAAAHRTPCLLLTHPRSEAVGSTVTRWRVGSHPAAPHPFDERAPGKPRFALRLERCRSRPIPTGALPFVVEWCDETHSFRMVSHLADRSDAPRRALRGAG
jgi:protein ImuA